MTRFHFLDEQSWSDRAPVVLGDSGQPVRFTPAVFDKGQGPWHKLGVEVTPERFNYYWEDRLVTSLPRSRITNQLEAWMNSHGLPGEAAPQVAPRSSLGLYIHNCTASFRRVVVEPIGEE